MEGLNDEMSMQLKVAAFNNYQELVDKALMIEGKQQQIDSRKRKYGPGKWYVHFASCFYINSYCIMGCYYALCHNTYAYSLLFYKVYMKRENAGSWNSVLEKEQILETYSAQLQKSWNSTEVIFRNNKKYWAKKIPEGAHTLATRVGGAPPASWAP